MIIEYDPASGRISHVVTFSFDFEAVAAEMASRDVSVLRVEASDVERDVSPFTHFVKDGTLAERPAMNLPAARFQIAADGKDRVPTKWAPQGATFSIDGDDLGKMTRRGLTADQPATWDCIVTCFPFLDAHFTVVAT